MESVLDLHSKNIIGNELVTTALKNAYYLQGITDKAKTIFHSDLGSQYTSKDMMNLCIKFNILQSFNKKGSSYDNACIESFHASIKKEEIYLNAYKDFEEAKIAIFRYIEGRYTNKRLHSAIN